MASPSPKPSSPQPTGSYTAVPGRLVPIPNTEFLLLLPDEEVPVVPPQPRGRPRGKAVEPCTCPHCVAGVVGNGQERHLCHFPDCGKTFTKTAHLQVGFSSTRGAVLIKYFCRFISGATLASALSSAPPHTAAQALPGGTIFCGTLEACTVPPISPALTVERVLGGRIT